MKDVKIINSYIDRKCEAVKPMNEAESYFAGLVKASKPIGFGRMIQIIRREWFLDNLPFFIQHKATKLAAAMGSGLVEQDEINSL